MRVFVYLPFVSCAIGIATARPIARRLDPRVAARVLVVTAVGLALATAGALALLGFAVVARIPLVARHGRWAASAVGQREPVPVWLGVLALVCIAAVVVNAIRLLDGYRRGLTQALPLQFGNSGQVVTVSDSGPLAYACRAWPFRPGVIVVSDGLQRSLDRDECSAVFAHEQSHLTHQHAMYELAGLLASAINPCLRPIQREVGFSLERWADEDAAGATDRAVAASALAASALQRAHSPHGVALAHATHGVAARVQALLENPRPNNRVLVSTIMTNAILATAAALLAAHSTELIFEALRR